MSGLIAANAAQPFNESPSAETLEEGIRRRQEQDENFQNIVACGHYYRATELAKMQQANFCKGILEILDERYGQFAEVPPRLPDEKLKAYAEIVKRFHALCDDCEFDHVPTVASVALFLSRVVSELTARQRMEYVAALSHYCGLNQVFDVTTDRSSGQS